MLGCGPQLDGEVFRSFDQGSRTRDTVKGNNGIPVFAGKSVHKLGEPNLLPADAERRQDMNEVGYGPGPVVLARRTGLQHGHATGFCGGQFGVISPAGQVEFVSRTSRGDLPKPPSSVIADAHRTLCIGIIPWIS